MPQCAPIRHEQKGRHLLALAVRVDRSRGAAGLADVLDAGSGRPGQPNQLRQEFQMRLVHPNHPRCSSGQALRVMPRHQCTPCLHRIRLMLATSVIISTSSMDRDTP